MIKWKYKPSGNCPVQAEGWFLKQPFYFRARGELATIEFGNYFYVLAETEEYAAGWLPKWYCRLLIWKGCLKFILKHKSYEQD
jgi:hypothetical protein